MRYIIIGGGIAGISAAKAIREHEQTGTIVVYSNEFHPLGLYARKDMLRRLEDGTYEQGELLLESQEALEQQGIKFVYQDIPRIYPKTGDVFKVHNIRRTYDRLLLATGAIPQLVDAAGLHLIGAHQIRNFEDITLLLAWLPELRTNGVVIIGGGILALALALDLAYALTRHSIPTTLVIREMHLGMPLLGESAGKLLEARLHTDGINILLAKTVTAFLSSDDKIVDAVQLDDGTTLPTRAAICAIGVRPNSALAQEAGIVVDGASGGIMVDEFMRTTAKNVFAAGNCALVNGSIARNWALSAEQGRIAGLNMVGHQVPYQPTIPGDLHTRIYDLPLAYFGQTTPSEPTSEVWLRDDGVSRAVRVITNRDRIVGASILGDMPGVADHLLAQYKAQAAITPDDLHHLALA